MTVFLFLLPADEELQVQFWNIKLDAELGPRTYGGMQGETTHGMGSQSPDFRAVESQANRKDSDMDREGIRLPVQKEG